MVFSTVNLKWSQKFKAFYSTGNLGLSNINKYDHHGAFDGFMELRKNEDGTQCFTCSSRQARMHAYYFGYEDNRLMIQSSDSGIPMTSSQRRPNAAKQNWLSLCSFLVSDEETIAFIKRFRKDYLGSSRITISRVPLFKEEG